MKVRIGKREVSLSTLLNRMVRGVLAAKIAYYLYIKRSSAKRQQQIVFFGHNFNGNLLAFAQYLKKHTDYEIAFMTDDPVHYKTIKKTGLENADVVLCVQHLHSLKYAANSTAVISSHGYIYLKEWLQAPKEKRPVFVDTWHGIGYKGDRAASLGRLKDYDMNFASSEVMRQFYLSGGVPEERVAVTGYARTDELVDLKLTPSQRKEYLESYGLDPAEKRPIALFAPTWNEKTQDEIFPFELTDEEFMQAMDTLAEKTGTLFVFRPHLNSDWSGRSDYSENVKIISAKQYPDAESLLKISDALITDWSSIASEFLALKRPIVYIDTPPTFEGSIAPLTAEDRPGARTTTLAELQQAYTESLRQPAKYMKKYQKLFDATIEHAWGTTLDGKSSERYLQSLERLLAKEKGYHE